MAGGDPTGAPGPRVLDVEHRGHPLSVAYLHRPGEGEALLYFHGLGCSKEDFIGAWSVPGWRDHTLVAFDAPGCGATRGHRRGIPLGVDDIVDTARALADHLGLEGLTAIGHSMGGLAAMLFALRYRDSVRRLVSVEGNLTPEDCSLYSRRTMDPRLVGREDSFLAELEREMRSSDVPGFAEAGRTLRRNVQDLAFFEYGRSIVDYSDHHPLLRDFLALDLPRLYVHGSENAHLSHIPHLARHGVTVRSIPGSNHFPFLSNPTAYWDVLADFVRETGR